MKCAYMFRIKTHLTFVRIYRGIYIKADSYERFTSLRKINTCTHCSPFFTNLSHQGLSRTMASKVCIEMHTASIVVCYEFHHIFSTRARPIAAQVTESISLHFFNTPSENMTVVKLWRECLPIKTIKVTF